MGIHDEKTKLKVPAVKRRAHDVADLPTGPAKAVKRKAQKPFGDGLQWENRIHVARRAGLLNSHGSAEGGWVVRPEEEGSKALFHLVPSEESLLTALSRVAGSTRDHYFDAMEGGASRACLVMHDSDSDVSGSGELLNAEAEEIASIHVGRKLAAKCTVGGNPAPLVVLKPVRHAVHALAGQQLVATIDPVSKGSLIPRLDHYVVAFQNEPRAEQRLMVVAALILADAWSLRPVAEEPRRRRNEIDLTDLFDLLDDRRWRTPRADDEPRTASALMGRVTVGVPPP